MTNSDFITVKNKAQLYLLPLGSIAILVMFQVQQTVQSQARRKNEAFRQLPALSHKQPKRLLQEVRKND